MPPQGVWGGGVAHPYVDFATLRPPSPSKDNMSVPKTACAKKGSFFFARFVRILSICHPSSLFATPSLNNLSEITHKTSCIRPPQNVTVFYDDKGSCFSSIKWKHFYLNCLNRRKEITTQWRSTIDLFFFFTKLPRIVDYYILHFFQTLVILYLMHSILFWRNSNCVHVVGPNFLNRPFNQKKR